MDSDLRSSKASSPGGASARRAFAAIRRSIPSPLRRVAAAAGGDLNALAALAAGGRDSNLPFIHRMAPRLALVASENRGGPLDDGSEPARWKDALLRSAAHRIRLDHALGDLAQQLGAVQVDWMPLKGMAFTREVYPDLAERPTSDLDVLVLPETVEAARRALIENGWRACERSEAEEVSVRSEGYNWKLVSTRGVALELHFRLWGAVPEGLARAVFAAGRAAPDLGPGGRRPALADAYLLNAVHAWLDRPHPMIYWWDLARLAEADADSLAHEVGLRSEKWGLALPVALSAAIATDLWGGGANAVIANRTYELLRLPERPVFSALPRWGITNLPFEVLAAARLLSNRPSRSGWRAVWRRIRPARV